MTGSGAKAKEAVTAKLPRQDKVNAAVDVAWKEKHHKRNKVRSNKEETGSVQSTGSTERDRAATDAH